MTTLKALLYSIVITIVSIILISISRGAMPTMQQALTNGFEMFIVAFVVLRFFAKGKLQ